MELINGVPALEGDGSYSFKLLVDGQDLRVENALATWFGGDDDPNDDGQTASGVVTKGNPLVLGCALPMNIGPCSGSPIPVMPYLTTMVHIYNRVTSTGITVPVIDIGPSRPPLAEGVIDLTQHASEILNGGKRNNMTVDFRIVGGARYLSRDVLNAIAEIAHA